MARPASDQLRRLHFINALFAHVTGHDLYLAEQIKAAITFSLAELEGQTKAHPDFAATYDVAFNASATRLLESFSQANHDMGFSIGTRSVRSPRRPRCLPAPS